MGNCESSAGCLWVKYYIVAGNNLQRPQKACKNITLLNFLKIKRYLILRPCSARLVRKFTLEIMGFSLSPTNSSCSCIRQKKRISWWKTFVEKKCSGGKNKTTFCILKKTGGKFSSLWPTLITPCMPIVQVRSLEYEDNAASGLCLTMHFFFFC